MTVVLIVRLLLLTSLPISTMGANILVNAYHLGRSHVQGVAIVGEALIKHGHNVDVLAVSADPYTEVYETYGLNILDPVAIPYSSQDLITFFETDILTYVYSDGFALVDFFARLYKMDALYCGAVLHNKEEIKASLQAYDLAITDSGCVCCVLLYDYLNIPYVIVHLVSTLSFGTDVPSPIAYVPMECTGKLLTDKMSFNERLFNLMIQLFIKVSAEIPGMSFVEPLVDLQRRHNISVDLYLNDFFKKAELHIWGRDIVTEFPRPLIPNIVPVGVLSARPPKQLPKQIQEFMDSSGEEGVIVVSMGIATQYLPVKTLNIIGAVLARLPQKVIFKYGGNREITIGENTKLVDWMPQNDVLGHNKTRLFITHGGANSYMESVYHGVPMVCLPIIVDQFDSAARIVAKGLGTYAELRTVTEKELHQAVTTVLSDNRYTKRVMDMSAILKDSPMNGTETAVFWIEHVIKHGAEHLKIHGRNLTTIEYYLLDVAAFICLTSAVILYVVYVIVSRLCRCCRKPIKTKYE